MQTHIQHELVGNCWLGLSAEGKSKNCLCSYTQMSLLTLMECFTLGRLMLNEGRQTQ